MAGIEDVTGRVGHNEIREKLVICSLSIYHIIRVSIS